MNNKYLNSFFFAFLIFTGSIFPAFGQLSITSTGTPFTIDFDNTVAGVNNGQFAGAGFSPTPGVGQINSNAFAVKGLLAGDINFGDLRDTGTAALGVSTGGVTPGGIYAFTVATGNNALGFQPTGDDLTPGEFILKIQNNTGVDATSIIVNYTIWYNNDQGRSTSFNVAFSSDGLFFTSATSDLNFSTPQASDGNGWQSVNRLLSIDLSTAPVPTGGYYFIKWVTDDVVGLGSRDELGLDDVAVTVNSPADSDSRVVDLGEQPETTFVPSIIDTENEAIEVFYFVIEDLGTSDFLPTKVKTLRFVPGPGNNAQWSTQIQSALVWDGGDYYIPGSVTIEDSYIDLNFPVDLLTVDDGESLPLGLLIYLNQSNILDGGELQFQILTDATGFDAYLSGSGFSSTFPETLSSNTLPITVQSSELRFISQPVNANTFEIMAADVSVEATDENGNRDLDFSGNISLSSSGTMTDDPISVVAVDGVATWLQSTDPIVHTEGGTGLTLTASSGALTSAISDPFDIIQTADQLAFTSYPLFGQRNTIVEPIIVSALLPDLTVDETFTGNVTLAINSGPGDISGTLVKPAVNGVAVFDNILFNTDGVYTLSATGPVYMTPAVSGEIQIVPFFQGFFSCPAMGWQSVLISGNAWVCDEEYASITGLGGASPTEAWYVSPSIDFGTLTDQVMIFDSWTSGTDTSHPRLEVLYSTDYSGTGNPNVATWVPLVYNIPVVNSAVWVHSGTIDLSGITTPARIAFKYTSSGTDPGAATEWRIDNVAITENGCLAPSNQSANILFENIQTTEMTLSWESGNGTGRIVLTSTSPISEVPADNTDYLGNSVYGTPGTELGDAFVVYKGNGNSVTVTGLDPATVYHFAIYEYNCDADNPTFNTTDPATGSQQTIDPQASDIIVNGSFVYPENIAYGTYQATALTMSPSNSLAVFGLTLRDGGASANSDEKSTILTSISFNANGSRAIKGAALHYGGVFIDSAYVNSSLNDFTFDISDTPIEAADLGTANFELYVTFMAGSLIVDNDQVVFSVTAATADPGGTLFSLPDAGGATSINSGGDENTIRVEATELKFVTVPSTTILINSPFTIEVEAVDTRNTRDRDVILDLSLFAGSGILSPVGDLQRTTANGTALWDNLQYNTEESGVIIEVADNAALLASIQTNPLNAKSGLSIFSFTGAAGDEPEFTPDVQPLNIVVGNISRGMDLEPQTLANAFNARNWPQTDTIVDDYYYEFTITANPGYGFSISSMELDHRRTGTGPNNWEIRTSLDNFALPIDQIFTTPAASTWYTNEEIVFGSAVQNETEVTIRIYAYNASGGLGTWGIDNLAIFGTVQDVQAPSFIAGYPQSDSTAVNGFDLVVNLDEAATVYYIVQDPVVVLVSPDFNQVLAGLDGDDNPAIAADTIVVTASGIDFYERVRGLVSDYGYDVYYVLYDSINYSDVMLQANVRTSDTDSELIAATSQPDAPYLISSVADSEAEAVNVFNFAVSDLGTADGAPTHITKLVFGQGIGNLVDNWSTTIAGATLYNISTASPIAVAQVAVNAASIEIDLNPGALTIADGTTEEIALSIWLTNSVIDFDVLEFTIGGVVTGNETYEIGSQFNSTLNALISNEYTINVTADRLNIVSYSPSIPNNNQNIELTVNATDENGNLDLDESSEVSIVLGQSNLGGLLSTDPEPPGLTQSLSFGSISWDNIQYSLNNDFITLIASSATLLNDTTGIIEIGNPDDLIVSSIFTLTENLNVGNVIITETGNLTINTGVTLSVSGDFTINGILNGQSGTVNFNAGGNTLQLINGAVSTANFYNITVTNSGTNGVRAEIDINLHNTLLLLAGSVFDADGLADDKNFTLVSTPTYTANIGPMGNGAELRGEIVWQRSLRTGPQGWRYIGTPIKGQTLANISDDVWIQGITESYPNAWTNIATYSEPLGTTGENGRDGWVDFNSRLDAVNPGVGMKLWLWNIDYASEQIIVNKGLPVVGDGVDGIAGSGETYDFSFSFTPSSLNGGGWNFFANPYPSEIDWEFVNQSELSGSSVYIWNPNSQQYGTYSAALDESIGGVTQYLASGQGFFVKANNSGASLSFAESHKSGVSRNSFLRISDEPIQKIKIELIASGGQKDETAIAFAGFASNTYDPEYDAIKLAGGWVNLSSLVDEKQIAINALGEKRGVQQVKLNVEPYVYGNYTMSFPVIESFNDAALIRLKDNYLNKTTYVNSSSVYQFNINQNIPETFGSDRFEIQFVEPARFTFASKAAKAGQEFVMPVYADQLADFTSALMTLSWDKDALSFVAVEDAGLGDMSNFDLSFTESGKLVYNQSMSTPSGLPDGSQLFSIRFRANNGSSQAAIRFEKAATRLKAIDDIDMPFSTEDVLINILQNKFVSGKVATFSGASVQDVVVKASGADELIEQVSNLEGAYKLNTYEQSHYTISASKSTDQPLQEVVTTSDIIRARLHLLGKERLTSPYQVIAADVNASNSVTALDLVEMQKIVLGINESFSSGLDWLILPDGQNLSENPFSYQSSIDLILTDQDLNQNFTGVKVGDLDDSWSSDNNVRKSGDLFKLSLQAVNMPEDIIEIPVIISETVLIRGYQFTINWDAGELAYYGHEDGFLKGLFNDRFISEGALTTLWDDTNGEPLEMKAGEILFTLKFRPLHKSATSDVGISSSITQAMALNDQMDIMSISATSARIDMEKMLNGNLELSQNVPNPFDYSTQIDFRIVKQGLVRFTIVNTLGEIVYIHEQNYDSGKHRIVWNRDQSLKPVTPGVYLYRLESNGENVVRKMLVK